MIGRVKRGHRGWPLMYEAGPVTVIIRGSVYRFSIRIGRAIDLAVWERKDA
jgi:hypothetical protein